MTLIYFSLLIPPPSSSTTLPSGLRSILHHPYRPSPLRSGLQRSSLFPQSKECTSLPVHRHKDQIPELRIPVPRISNPERTHSNAAVAVALRHRPEMTSKNSTCRVPAVQDQCTNPSCNPSFQEDRRDYRVPSSQEDYREDSRQVPWQRAEPLR